MDKDQQLKEQLDDASKEKSRKKETCEKMKINIKSNRERFKKQENEFKGLIDDAAEMPVEENKEVEEDKEMEDAEDAEVKEQEESDDEDSQIESGAKKAKIEPEGYKQILRTKKINHTFDDEQIKVLARDKANIVRDAQVLHTELDQASPNLSIILEYKQKLNDFQDKERILRECEQFIQTSKETLNASKKKRHDEFIVGFEFISS